MSVGWYLRRARAMSVRELAGRLRDVVVRRRLERRLARAPRDFRPGFVPIDVSLASPELADAARRAVAGADRIVEGEWEMLGTVWNAAPEWFVDPYSRLTAPSGSGLRLRVRNWPGSLKHVWEPSRHQYLTAVAVAAAVTKDEAYATLVEAHLTDWWEANPPPRGVHWTSGIEVGLRLVSWVWIRRLLDPFQWRFEEDERFVRQLWAHQEYLHRLPSRGSSANNHLVAEAAGAFVAGCAFPSSRSERWATAARRDLERAMDMQVGADGLHRELSPGYHALVTELFALAAIEGELAGRPLSDRYWRGLASMFDAAAAIVDSEGNPPRQNDADDAYGLMLDGPGFDRWDSLLTTGARLVGALDWWPIRRSDDLRSAVLGATRVGRPVDRRAADRPTVFADTGQVFLHADWRGVEAWCHCDGGPHGYLATAAHGHCDALGVEFRHGGVEVLVDPGTFMYQGDPAWREYFRSTRAHNTLQVGELEQAESGGAFLWTSVPTVTMVGVDTTAEPAWWEASHDGYVRHGGPQHRRRVELDDHGLRVEDTLSEAAEVALRFHLGPDVSCELDESSARMGWKVGERTFTGRFELPDALAWRVARGETDPPLGWFSPSFGVRIPTSTLEGRGRVAPHETLTSILTIEPGVHS